MSFLLGVLFLVSASQTQETTTTSPPATAQDSAQPATGGAEKAKKNEKKICRREASTESRLGGKRICLTAEQWRARQ
ncbi:MAG TPA: hypothetical protein VJ775_00975 [Sphingomicrobium sp.]|nr:hypothetical protein [Sphingomicrobium sp.]